MGNCFGCCDNKSPAGKPSPNVPNRTVIVRAEPRMRNVVPGIRRPGNSSRHGRPVNSEFVCPYCGSGLTPSLAERQTHIAQCENARRFSVTKRRQMLLREVFGVEDEKQIPSIGFQKVVTDAGTVTWTRFQKGSISLEYIQKLANMTEAEACKLSTEDKRLWFYLRVDKDKREAGRGNDIFSAEPILLVVEREHFLRDSFEQFKTTTDLDLRREIKIHFLNEVSQDAGGLIREWFSVLVEDLFDPQFKLFKRANTCEVSYLINEYSQQQHSNHLEYFYFCGQVIAKALYERIPIKAYLNKIILKQILGQSLKVEDMKYADTEIYNSLHYILTTTISPETSICNFAVTRKDPATGAETMVELKPGGNQIPVDETNKTEFARLYFDQLCVTNVETQTKSFLAGFGTLLKPSVVTILDLDELELFVCGEPKIDIKDWMENSCYGGEYSESHPVIQNFWKMLKKLSSSDVEKLLQFFTGSKRVPAEGFKGLRAANGRIELFRIEPRPYVAGSDNGFCAFIIAHTCFNKIELPMYPDLETMEGCVKKILESPAYFQFSSE